MDMDLAWCPVCESAIPYDDATVSPAPSRPSSSLSSHAPLPHNGSSARLNKSKQGTVKAKGPGATGMLRNNISGKSLATRGALKSLASDPDATAGKKPTKRVQLSEAPRLRLSQSASEEHHYGGVEASAAALYCSEECRLIDEARADEAYLDVASHRPPPGMCFDDDGQPVSPPRTDMVAGYVSDYYLGRPELAAGSPWPRCTEHAGEGVEPSASATLSHVSAAGAAADATPRGAPRPRSSGSRGLRPMTSIVSGEESTISTATLRPDSKPMTLRSKSDNGALKAVAAMATGLPSPSPPLTDAQTLVQRQAHSFDKPRHTPLLLAPNGTPLIQPTFTRPRQPYQHPSSSSTAQRKSLSISPGSPASTSLSRPSDSAPSTHGVSSSVRNDCPPGGACLRGYDALTHKSLAERQEKAHSLYQDYGLFYQQPRRGSSNSVASLGRSPPGEGLSTSFGSGRGPRWYQQSMTPRGGFTGGLVASSTPRVGSSSSVATSRRNSGSSATAGWARPGDSDHSSPPSSPGVGPMRHPAVAGVIKAAAEEAKVKSKAAKSWSWDHLPHYVPQYPAMDVEKIRRSRSGAQVDEVELAKVPVPSRKKLFVFATED